VWWAFLIGNSGNWSWWLGSRFGMVEGWLLALLWVPLGNGFINFQWPGLVNHWLDGVGRKGFWIFPIFQFQEFGAF